MDCLFCKIIAGEIPSIAVYEDAELKVIRDIQPQAPTHLLVLPKKHLDSVAQAQDPDDERLLGRMLLTAAKIARQEGLDEGYRLAINTGVHGAQSVRHLHLHILGGRQLGGSMG